MQKSQKQTTQDVRERRAPLGAQFQNN